MNSLNFGAISMPLGQKMIITLLRLYTGEIIIYRLQ